MIDGHIIDNFANEGVYTSIMVLKWDPEYAALLKK